MSLLFSLHPGPSNTVRVLANAGVTDATSRKTMRRAAPTVCCGCPARSSQTVFFRPERTIGSTEDEDQQDRLRRSIMWASTRREGLADWRSL
ncbi:unnamed protein product [Spirodela intermedia]|uniref:Uncharacterized protein n=1 Tax=Spirodela intermedia TaxID=51605 RepID=A0ABN7E8X0_SPIIN|nr:unnamed protein product [Spirodela intermedia]CAA6674763.1 unnamed protein product [Spirodela intermedia]